MTNHHCLIVPHYHHVPQLTDFFPELAACGYPVFVVDDGSSEAEQAQLRALVADAANVELLQLSPNRGKGHAVRAGLEAAAQAGFSHATTVDADGQHALGDLGKLLRAADAQPEAIICAAPVFGNDIPKARLHGRKITNTLVNVATWSTVIRDAMCGFRTYPVGLALALTAQNPQRARMEFDVEILVRAVWQDIALEYIESPVRYPANGASNFRMVADNLRLTWMHTTLITLGLVRLPKLLWRRLHATPLPPADA